MSSRALAVIKEPVSVLSPQERKIAELVVAGNSNKQIAFKMQLQTGTIKEYLNRVYAKTRFSNRTELAVAYVTGRIR